MYEIWLGLKDLMGFDGAVAFLYIGLTILIPLAIYFFLRCCVNYYREVDG